MAKLSINSKAVSVDLPLFISFYVEHGYIIMNFNKRIILNKDNKVDWIPLLNIVANGKKARINCALTCRDEFIAKNTLKQLGLLESTPTN